MNSIILAIIVVPVLEIYLFIKIGSQIGAITTIFLIFTTAIIGVYYAKYEGLNTLRSGFSQLSRNETPTYEVISGAAIAFAAILLIIPGIYLTARFYLFGAQIMFEDNKVFESIAASWNKTDEYASKLFVYTLVFFSCIFFIAIILTLNMSPGILLNTLLAFIEYIFIIPLGYIYFTLYKSIKSS